MLKKILCFATALSVAAVSFASCKSKTDDKPKKAGETKTVTVEQDTELETLNPTGDASQTKLALKDFGGAEILYYSPSEPTNETKGKISTFQKTHNCKVKISVGTGKIGEDLNAAKAAGTAYDIIETDNSSFIEVFKTGLLNSQNEFISPADIYTSEASANRGLNSAVLSRFTVGENIYAVGSSDSCDFYLLYYNKKLFKDIGFDDLYSLFVTGRFSTWSLNAMGSVNDYISGTSLLQLPSLSDWFNIKAQPVIGYEEGNFVSKFYNNETLAVAESYQSLIYGENPISIPKSGSYSFENGKAYMFIGTTSRYSELITKAAEKSVFDKNKENLGCVPLPSDINTGPVQSAASVKAYSSMNGAANPDAAACYALFESRVAEQSGEDAVPVTVTEYIVNTFNTNGYVPELGFSAADGKSSVRTIIDSVGMKLRDGNDHITAMSTYMWQVDSIVKSALTDTSQSKK